jgi:hypothetical protein
MEWAIATLVGIVAAGFVLAYFLLKVDMSPTEYKVDAAQPSRNVTA